MMFPKSRRIIDDDLRRTVRLQPCAACGKRAIPGDVENDPHHVSTKGAGGDDVPSNLMSLCREHHTEWDKIAPSRMIAKYVGIERWLENMGRFDILEGRRSK